MPKYWGKQIFAHGSFPEVGQKQKTEKKNKKTKVGNNNGQLRIARKAAWANLLRFLMFCKTYVFKGNYFQL